MKINWKNVHKHVAAFQGVAIGALAWLAAHPNEAKAALNNPIVPNWLKGAGVAAIGIAVAVLNPQKAEKPEG